MENKPTKFWLTLGVMPFVVPFMYIVGLPFAIWRAFVVVTLFKWFAVPYFHLTPLTIPLAMAFIILWASFDSSLSIDKNVDTDWKMGVIMIIISPASWLLIGWVLHHWFVRF